MPREAGTHTASVKVCSSELPLAQTLRESAQVYAPSLRVAPHFVTPGIAWIQTRVFLCPSGETCSFLSVLLSEWSAKGRSHAATQLEHSSTLSMDPTEGQSFTPENFCSSVVRGSFKRDSECIVFK